MELHVNGDVVVPEREDSEQGWITYRPKPKQFRPGDNALLFRVTATPAREQRECRSPFRRVGRGLSLVRQALVSGCQGRKGEV